MLVKIYKGIVKLSLKGTASVIAASYIGYSMVKQIAMVFLMPFQILNIGVEYAVKTSIESLGMIYESI